MSIHTCFLLNYVHLLETILSSKLETHILKGNLGLSTTVPTASMKQNVVFTQTHQAIAAGTSAGWYSRKSNQSKLLRNANAVDYSLVELGLTCNSNLIPYYAHYQASLPAMWGNQSPTAEGIQQLRDAFIAEWKYAVDQMLRHWERPPIRT